MGETTIGWTSSESGAKGYTFNLWHGCTKVGTDCKNCYAETQSNRYQRVKWGPNVPRVAVGEGPWAQVLKWNAAAEKAGEMRRVFCMSMGDLFEEAMLLVGWNGVPLLFGSASTCDERGVTMDYLRERLWKLIERTPWLDWLLLTKRPENINGMIPEWWRDAPPRNVMFGMSAGNQATFDERFPAFCEVKGRKFLSLEPLIGPLDFYPIRYDNSYLRTAAWEARVNWVIVGGESGPGARPLECRWVRNIVLGCREAQVPVYVKQLGAKPFVHTGEVGTGQYKYGYPIKLPGRSKGENWDEWPSALDDLKVREFPVQFAPVGTGGK